jgi:type II secretory pathway component GspD/PulD (secretin)
LAKTDSAWENINRVKVYKVDNVDVESIEDMVREMQSLGRLEAETRIQIDERNGTIIAYATPPDHMTLAHLVRSFQQEPREAHVIQLTILEPRYAAQAVRVLFNQGESEDDYWRRRRYGDSEEEAFRVEADQAHRRLLIWATATEHQRVTDYLSELGERAAVAGARQGVRVISTGAAEFSDIETKLRDVWGSISEVPLVIHTKAAPSATSAISEVPVAQPTDAAQPDDAAHDDPERRATLPDATPDIKASSDAPIRTASHLQLVANDEREECAADEHVVTVALAREEGVEPPVAQVQATEPPPVRVIAGPDGRLIVVSDDPAAAQLMTELLQSLLPEEKDVQIFPLKYASALSVEFQLQDLLNLDDEDEQTDPLSVEKPKLLIYSDGRTNRLLVRHASAEQLAVIRNLVSVLDQPEEVEPQLARQQWLYKVRSKDAVEISETVKEVYRDLLSSSDKAFEGGGERRSRSAGYWGFASARSTVPEYQGLLSVGVDLSSNSLVVSAPQYLMTEVKQLVLSLDQQPSGQAISIMRLQNGTSGVVSQTLGQVLGESNQNGNRGWRGR